MCLSRLMSIKEEKKYKKLVKRGFGWKFFNRNPAGQLCGAYYGAGKSMPVNRWLKSQDYESATKGLPIQMLSGSGYTPGFHVYLTRKDAREEATRVRNMTYEPCIVKKVKFQDVVAQGYQHYFSPCVVVQDILIVK